MPYKWLTIRWQYVTIWWQYATIQWQYTPIWVQNAICQLPTDMLVFVLILLIVLKIHILFTLCIWSKALYLLGERI